MQSRNIKVRLNDESISQAISSLKEYKKTLKYKQAALMKELGEHGFEVMVREIDSYPMPYSKDDLINSVSYECTGRTVTIYNASDHALFVEFGTGIVGSRSPHPHDTIGYHYDVNNHGDDGWYYRDEGEWQWTKGMPSRPFAHGTYETLRAELIDIVKKVFQQ